MAQGSETISTRWVEGAKRECVKCGAPIKNLQRDVGEVRTTYPGRVREIICTACHMAKASRVAGYRSQASAADNKP